MATKDEGACSAEAGTARHACPDYGKVPCLTCGATQADFRCQNCGANPGYICSPTCDRDAEPRRERALPEGQEERVCSHCGCEHRCGTIQAELTALRSLVSHLESVIDNWDGGVHSDHGAMAAVDDYIRRCTEKSNAGGVR